VKYGLVQPIGLLEAEACLESDDPTLIADSLLRASLSDIDHCWVESACLHALDRPELGVRWAALSALGHLARRYRHVDVSTVMAAIQPLRAIPSVSGKIDDLLGDINVFVCNENEKIGDQDP